MGFCVEHPVFEGQMVIVGEQKIQIPEKKRKKDVSGAFYNIVNLVYSEIVYSEIVLI